VLNNIVVALGWEPLNFGFILDGVTVKEIIDFLSIVLSLVGSRGASSPVSLTGSFSFVGFIKSLFGIKA
jgi:hypothetical protein